MAKRRSMKSKSMKRRMTKRRMSKMRHSKKMIRKSRKMRGGDISDYLPNWITGKKEEQQVPVSKYDNTTNFSPEYEQQSEYQQ